MDYEALENWIQERLDAGEDATVYEFIREVMGRSKEYDEYRPASEAKMSTLAEQIEALTNDNTRLKSHNYDLLMQIPEDDNNGDGEVIENNEEDGEIYHIDNLFVDSDEEKEID